MEWILGETVTNFDRDDINALCKFLKEVHGIDFILETERVVFSAVEKNETPQNSPFLDSNY